MSIEAVRLSAATADGGAREGNDSEGPGTVVFISSCLGPTGRYSGLDLWGPLSRAPLGSAEQLGAFYPPPLRSREPRNVATSGKRHWIALGVNSLKLVIFF